MRVKVKLQLWRCYSPSYRQSARQDTHPYEHPSRRCYKREIFGLSEDIVLLVKLSGLLVSVIDCAPFPEVAVRYGSTNVKLCIQQIDEVITAVGILLAESSQPADIPIRLPSDEQLGH